MFTASCSCISILRSTQKQWAKTSHDEPPKIDKKESPPLDGLPCLGIPSGDSGELISGQGAGEPKDSMRDKFRLAAKSGKLQPGREAEARCLLSILHRRSLMRLKDFFKQHFD